MNDKQPIVIVVKKKKKKGGHHGGSWKVAYADFVTAMMAFFLVMWIVGMDSDVKDVVEGYFNNPVGFRRAFGSGASPVSQGSTPLPTALVRMPMFVRQVETRTMNTVRERILEDLEGVSGADEFGSNIEVLVTPDGLRVELREGPSGSTFFQSGSAGVQPAASAALRVIASNIGEIPNDVIIEGHTDAAPYGTLGYTNWELSADRANAARRLLIEFGLPDARVSEVRGHADRDLLLEEDPFDPSNRRVSILIPYMEIAEPGEQGAVTGGG